MIVEILCIFKVLYIAITSLIMKKNQSYYFMTKKKITPLWIMIEGLQLFVWIIEYLGFLREGLIVGGLE